MSYKEQITDKEGICISATFIMGTTLMMGISGEAGNDIWVSVIIGVLMAIPMILIYSRILSLFQGKDFLDILEAIAGKIVSKIIGIIYVWYAFHLGALVIHNFGQFVNVASLPETPIIVPLFFLGITCIAGARAGVEVIGRVSSYLLPIVMIIIVFVQILVIPQLNINYIKPVLGYSISSILRGGFSAFSFPFAESIILVNILTSLKTKKSPYKVYLSGTLLAGITILILTVRNIMVLGDMREWMYFPSYSAVSRISIGDFVQRIEVTVAFVFVVGAFIKATVCLFAASYGISKIFNLHDYRSIVIQTGLLMIYFSYTIYGNIMEMRNWAFKVYPYYAFPFQVIIPLIIWIIAEIKVRKNRAKLKNSN